MSAEVLRYAAFTQNGHGGNPAGVVLDAGALTDRQMLAVAQAIGYSETAFVVPSGAQPDGSTTAAVADRPARAAGREVAMGARLRFFSPVSEVAFCGHATVATAVALAERQGPGRMELTTQAGPVPVTTRIHDGELVATLTSPSTTTRPVEEAVLDETLGALRWTREHLDPRYPTHVAFAGNQHLVLGVRSRDTLARLDYDYPALEAVMSAQRWTTTHLFWSESATTFHVRNPFPPGGVVEDPATGAAAAAFGGYLRDLRLVPLPTRVTLHQGHDMGAPSLLLVDLAPDTTTVRLTGHATRLALSPYDELDEP
ncbi:MAG TPA: PhzF family phenazine biosynthesis isomerase [Nocardioidaceae bacterium]|nr:PhzF family phenazine biosynthesis isomerase [Nocardioidaceae bacterium]